MPKQFTPLIGDDTLFGLTLDRLVGVAGLVDAIVVTGAAHRDHVAREIEESELDALAIVVEPTGRNTAPAAVAAALLAEPGDVLVILPADHLILDRSAFREALQRAVTLASAGHLVTFGIEPDRAETGYGYIEVGESIGDGLVVARFIEKPDPAAAAILSTDGQHLWNSGIFIARADVFLDEARAHCPEVVEGVAASLPTPATGLVELFDEFGTVESMSIDYAIMERTDRAVVVPLRAGWSDVGSYLTLFDVSERDNSGNHVSGDVTAVDTTNSFLKSTSRRLVVAGVEGLIVVETPDAVLVVPLDRSQQVKDLQEAPPD